MLFGIALHNWLEALGLLAVSWQGFKALRWTLSTLGRKYRQRKQKPLPSLPLMKMVFDEPLAMGSLRVYEGGFGQTVHQRTMPSEPASDAELMARYRRVDYLSYPERLRVKELLKQLTTINANPMPQKDAAG